MASKKIVGIDLAGVETRPTGFCVADEDFNIKTMLLYTDREIVEETFRVKPTIISIDAPLALPRGRCCLRDDCECRGAGHLRECDRILLKMGIRFFPVTLGPMRKLTVRGIRLSGFLNSAGLKVVESFPHSIRVILGFPEGKEGLDKLKKTLIPHGVDIRIEKLTEHEVDAIFSAIVGRLYLEGRAVEIGDPKEALMVIPNPILYSFKPKKG